MDFQTIINRISGLLGIIAALILLFFGQKPLAELLKDFKERYKNNLKISKTNPIKKPYPFLKIEIKILGIYILWPLATKPLIFLVGETFLFYSVFFLLKIPINFIIAIFVFLINFLCFYYLQDRLIYFFAQFILPIHTPQERQKIYNDVKFGLENPIWFIKNGKTSGNQDIDDAQISGFVITDTASAAVLRTGSEIRNVIGPGVTLTSPGEYPAGSVDLRTQLVILGPQPSDQPFATLSDTNATLSNTNEEHKQHIEEHKQHIEEQERRQETNGWTRDGIEVIPTIKIKYSIQRPSPDSYWRRDRVNSSYGFNPSAVGKATIRRFQRWDFGENIIGEMDLSWDKLPSHLVVNLWREYIQKYKLNDLFTNSGVSGLQTIEDMINKRVRQSKVVELDTIGLPTGEWQESLEFKQLQLRGLEIINVSISNTFFDPSIEDRIFQQTLAEHIAITPKTESLVMADSIDEASKKFARIVSEKFAGKITMPQQNPFKTLQLLIQPLKDFIIKEYKVNDVMELQLSKLDIIWKWLLENSSENTSDGSQK